MSVKPVAVYGAMTQDADLLASAIGAVAFERPFVYSVKDTSGNPLPWE